MSRCKHLCTLLSTCGGPADPPKAFDFLVSGELVRLSLEQLLLAQGASAVRAFMYGSPGPCWAFCSCWQAVQGLSRQAHSQPACGVYRHLALNPAVTHCGRLERFSATQNVLTGVLSTARKLCWRWSTFWRLCRRPRSRRSRTMTGASGSSALCANPGHAHSGGAGSNAVCRTCSVVCEQGTEVLCRQTTLRRGLTQCFQTTGVTWWIWQAVRFR